MRHSKVDCIELWEFGPLCLGRVDFRWGVWLEGVSWAHISWEGAVNREPDKILCSLPELESIGIFAGHIIKIGDDPKEYMVGFDGNLYEVVPTCKTATNNVNSLVK